MSVSAHMKCELQLSGLSAGSMVKANAPLCTQRAKAGAAGGVAGLQK